jgi:hypothetical protein
MKLLGERQHLDRPVWLDTTNATSVINKRHGRGDAASVYRNMQTLWQSPFRPYMPEPLALNVETQVVTMEALDGSPMGRRGDGGTAITQRHHVAQLLTALHHSGATVARHRDRVRLIESLRRKIVDGELERTIDIIDAVSNRTDACAPVVCHGDFSPRNVLVANPAKQPGESTDSSLHAGGDRDATRLWLIDFDRLQMASPARDVAYWGAWLWVTAVMNNQPPSWASANGFAEAYLRANHDVTADVDFHRACALVRIAASWSVLRDRPAVRSVILAEALTSARGDRGPTGRHVFDR